MLSFFCDGGSCCAIIQMSVSPFPKPVFGICPIQVMVVRGARVVAPPLIAALVHWWSCIVAAMIGSGSRTGSGEGGREHCLDSAF